MQTRLLKPGKPVALEQIAGTAFIGLPGNPAAAYVTARAVLKPLVLHLSGARDLAPALIVRSGFATQQRPGGRESLRVCLQPCGNGTPPAVPAPAGALSGLAASDELVELAEDPATIQPGDALPYTQQGNMG